MKRKTMLLLLAALLVAAAAAAMIVLRPKGEKLPEFGQTLEASDWVLDEGWGAVEENGARLLAAQSDGVTTSWNTALSLAASCQVSADVRLYDSGRERGCARLVFGDEFRNVCVSVSVEYSGTEYVRLTADELLNRGTKSETNGWSNFYTDEQWTRIDPKQPLRLTVTHDASDSLLMLSLSQNGSTLVQTFTSEAHAELLATLRTVGLGTYDADAVFSEITVESLE